MPANNADAPNGSVPPFYQRLAEVAANLNKASDELTISVAPLEEALKRLNFGIECWYPYDAAALDDSWTRYIGYAKIGPKWGLSLRRVVGPVDPAHSGSDDRWLFSDAPREMRIEAVDHIPTFVAHLIEEAQNYVDVIRQKTAQTVAYTRNLLPDPTLPARSLFSEKLERVLNGGNK